jgi:hypothetical protein
MKANTFPVLLTLHVRFANLNIQLDTLKKYGTPEVYVSIDGPRSESERDNQEKILKIIGMYKSDFKKLEVNLASENLGLACGMIRGIDWFFTKVEKGAIFEDDIIFTGKTIDFLTQALDLTASFKDVLMVGGSQPFMSEDISPKKILLTNYPQIWGWATSRTKWNQLRSYITEEPQWDRISPMYVRNFWKVGWQRVSEGYLDTWDLPIAGGMLANGKYCALPPINLTCNVGYDDFSTNTSKKTFPLGLEIGKIDLTELNELISSDQDVSKLNKKYENQIFKVKKRNLLSPLLQPLDRIRFKKKKKLPLEKRLKKIAKY